MRNLALMCVLSGVILFAAVTLLSAANNTEQQATRVKPPVLTARGEKNQNVSLQSLDIQVEVAGNIASTRYTMVVKNITDRILEGIATFPLPDERNVAITYYALDINGKMREAVPVEKARGTQVFEAIKNRRVDPGLLEWVEGSTFRSRVYPVPANETRTFSIVCEEELTFGKDSLYYRLPMAYTDSLEKFTIGAIVLKSGQKPRVLESEDGVHFDADGENYTATFARENYRPSRALVFTLPVYADTPQVMTQPAQGSQYFLASVAPKMETREKQWADDLAIIWDVSLSGALRDSRREMEMLDIIFAEKKNANIHLYFLNNKNVKQGEYKIVGGNWEILKNALKTAVFDGGTDFSQIDLENIAGNEILFFSDGISTLSDADFLKNNKVSRPIHCVVSSTKADYSVMKLIAGKTRGKFINSNALFSEGLKDALLYETPLFLGAEYGDAVREVYPAVVTPVHGNFSVAGISNVNNAELTLLFGFGNKVEKRIKVQLGAKNAANRENTDKIWARKKIAELDLNYEKNRAKIAELRRQFGIVTATRNTSLIVLESVYDYINYGIEPPVSSPLLLAEYRRITGEADSAKPRTRTGVRDNVVNVGSATVPDNNVRDKKELKPANGGSGSGQGGIENVQSTSDMKQLKPSTSQGAGSSQGGGDPRARVTHNRILGIVSGGGQGITTPMGTVKRPSPGVLNRSSSKLGSDDDLFANFKSPNLEKYGGILLFPLTGGRSRSGIQRVVMQNIAALRYDYKRRVRERPGLEGVINVKFAIDEFGKVISVQEVRSTVNDSTLESNVVNRVKNWEFERIDKPGDVTEVTYPFAFSDGNVTGGSVYPPDARRREIVPQSKEGGTLNGAVAAAGNLKKWWNIDFAEFQGPKIKYPAPDESAEIKNINSVSGGFAKDNDYLNKLTGKIADDYQTYLKLRNDHADLPAYYFDMAHWFYNLGDRETALRVLTSIADLELENAQLYRLLGYQFKEYGEYALEKFVCRKVVQWRPMEPQSYRDYALALADNGEKQAALDSLYALLKKNYSYGILYNSRGIEEVIVMEINHLIAKNPELNTSKIDKRLKINIPVDIRVVINWNMSDIDIDLYVEDPNDEECSYDYRQTYIGGRISTDNKSGYGPEQFILKKAVKGKYWVYVRYYSKSRDEFEAAGPLTIMAEVYTKYGDKAEQRKVIALQTSKRGASKLGGVQVAEFEF